jgi:hypothetical protein
VSLAMNTFQHGRHMDFNFTNPSGARWYFAQTISQEDRDWKAFFSLFDDDKVEFQDLILSCNIRARTIGQTDSFWMTDRSFCATSSTVNGMVKVRAEDIAKDHQLCQSYATLLHYIGQEDWFPNDEPEEEPEVAAPVGDVGGGPPGDAEPDPHSIQAATRLIEKLAGGGDVKVGVADDFKQNLRVLPEDLAMAMLLQIPKAASRCEGKTID